MIAALQATQNTLNAQHRKECLEKRGLNPEWIVVNCRSVTANEASQQLGYTAQSDGIWLQGCNYR
jgi:putative DNA primase/helicase